MKELDTIVIGGGAAGIFTAVNIDRGSVLVLERTQKLLSKVKISGGGRCNVTHACFDPAQLVKHYPRGGKSLRGPFSRFQPQDTIAWFAEREVQLHTETDGRMFPTTNDSQTIIDCLMEEVRKKGVDIRRGEIVRSVQKQGDRFKIETREGSYSCKQLILATGSSLKGHEIARQLGHEIIEPVPSLFTFNIPDSPLLDLAGVSVQNASVSVSCSDHTTSGPVLLTHWGFSGPAILKLSAWAARELHECDYHAEVSINWTGESSVELVKQALLQQKEKFSGKSVKQDPLYEIPRQLWARYISSIGVPEQCRWTNLSKEKLNRFADRLYKDIYSLNGKTTYKKEFVTAGGINLDEINFKTMESKVCQGLYCVGEVLNIDGVTGGFNFQNAWTTSFIAATSF